MRTGRSAILVISTLSVIACQTMATVGNSLAPVPTAGTAPALPSRDSHSRPADGAAMMLGQGVVGIAPARRADAAARANSLSSAASVVSSHRKAILITIVIVAILAVALAILVVGSVMADFNKGI
jgi:hypothetical protein